MPHFRISEAAVLAGVSDDTLRRWIKAEGIDTQTDASGRTVVDGVAVAGFARKTLAPPEGSEVRRSARNHFTGIVTAIKTDAVMAQVDLQCGPFRVVSLMSSEAVEELGLEVGSVATAVVKATTVIIETSPGSGR